MKKGLKEVFAEFFSEPTREGLKEIIDLGYSESNNIEFKSEWIDKAELAKIILSIANSGGGCIIFGLEEKDKVLISNGIEKVKDEAEFTGEIEKFLPRALIKKIELINFRYDEVMYPKVGDKIFQVIFIGSDKKYVPYICESDGNKIYKGDIYIRRGTSSKKINYEELQELLNERVETEYSSSDEILLENELEELKILYSEIPEYKSIFAEGITIGLFEGAKQKNKNYPKEEYEEFISRMIEKKKKQIEELI